MGTEATTCIRLEPVETSPEILKGLGKLKKLRVLLLSGREDDSSSSDWKFDQVNFPNALQFLNWEGYPLRSLPQTFRGNNLVGLELPHSRIMQFWESGEKKVLKKLKFLSLTAINVPASTENYRKRSFADLEATNRGGDST
ncbi:hypothetical protein L2E82_14533 [Cichorium intybus]|uniref:Uncharacterized protein n=1 Tax=Cichorium intybus TaxID=13427 RepID=A0ACB9F095_CICIN|nr:hypothetical protein L2E82_14533 [Cichorium intybus]